MNLKSKKGFTLVELIIVIAILGIIALIAVPSLTGIQQRSQVNADIRTAEQIGKAVRIYLTDTASGDLTVAPDNTYKLYNTFTNIENYISTGYKPKSWKGTGEAAYYVKVVDGAGEGDTRVIVAIGNDDSTGNTAYTSGATAGVAYVEGSSSLSQGITDVLGS